MSCPFVVLRNSQFPTTIMLRPTVRKYSIRSCLQSFSLFPQTPTEQTSRMNYKQKVFRAPYSVPTPRSKPRPRTSNNSPVTGTLCAFIFRTPYSAAHYTPINPATNHPLPQLHICSTSYIRKPCYSTQYGVYIVKPENIMQVFLCACRPDWFYLLVSSFSSYFLHHAKRYDRSFQGMGAKGKK